MAVEIRATSQDDLNAVRELWAEYWRWLRLPGDFQGFEEERQTLPGLYAPPAGRLLVAAINGRIVGTAALRPVNGTACEAKRVFVLAEQRGLGVGRALMLALMDEGRAAGYSTMYADTLPAMTAARALYRDLGFAETEPYSQQPTPGAVYLRRDLRD